MVTSAVGRVVNYRLGIDVGTTFTAAAVANGGSPSMLGLGNRALQIPSVLFVQPEGGFLVGEAAERRGAVDPSRLVREFKRRIGDPVPLVVAGSPYSPQTLTAQLLRWVIDLSTERMDDSPTLVVVTHPANWGPYKMELLRQVLLLAGVDGAQICPEPLAAAMQYASRARVAIGDRIAVYDLGGGTFDVCVLEKTVEGFAVLGVPDGVEQLGGIDFDEAVFQHVLGVLKDRGAVLHLDDPGVTEGLVRLRRECVEAKEALSQDVNTVVPVSLPGMSTSVRLTRAEFENMIRPSLADTHTAVRRALESARVETADLRAVVLVGGSSRIPVVGELLEHEFGVPAARDTHPKHDVALGSVLLEAATLDHADAAPAAPTRPAPARPLQPTQPRVPALPASVSASVPLPIEETDAKDLPVSVSPTKPIAAPTRRDDKPPSVPPTTPADATRKKRLLAAAAGLLIALAVVLIVINLPDGSSAPPNTAATPTKTSKSSPDALPRSAVALTADQLVVGRSDGDHPSQIYVGDVNSPTPGRQLTSGAGSAFSPTLSPDRKTVIYVNQIGTARTLRVVSADGTGDRALFRQTPVMCNQINRPAWNPVDPTVLATVCTDKSGRIGLYLLKTNGDYINELRTGFDKVDDPAFSPDGTEVAYYARDRSTFDGGSIFRIKTDGNSLPTRLTQQPAGTDADPSWSRDGSLIAFRRRSKQNSFQIMVMNALDGSKARALTNDLAWNQDPSWSPDGTHIAFKRNKLGTQPADPPRTWIMNAKTGRGKRLLWRDVHDGQSAPAWTRR